jgi:hypothetical protein
VSKNNFARLTVGYFNLSKCGYEYLNEFTHLAVGEMLILKSYLGAELTSVSGYGIDHIVKGFVGNVLGMHRNYLSFMFYFL